MSGFKVIQPGMLSLIQDAGRFGHHGIGLTTGGPLDRLAFDWANRLCGNTAGATVLEASIGGLVLEATAPTLIVVTGADVPLTINGENRELWHGHEINTGDRIELGFCSNGCRNYLAVPGGLDIKPSFGSAATVTRESIGGLNGKALQQNDFLPYQTPKELLPLRLDEKYRPHYTGDVTLRVIPGYQQHSFSRVQQRIFFGSRYTVSDLCDRMGYRLEGPPVKSSVQHMLSEGICLGAIQIPADGQPIVLLNDRQTIGGYPKMGSVLSLDIAPLGQLLPGGTLRFKPITIDQAHNEVLLAKSRFDRTQPERC